MAGAVGAAVGVVSTVAGMGEQGRQRRIQQQQAQVQQYAQEVQYEQEKMNIRQQQEYARQTRSLEDMQLKAQDLQMSNALYEQALQAQAEETQLGYQLELKGLQDQGALQAAEQALQLAEYQQNELFRGKSAQADERQSQQVNAISQQSAEVAKLLGEGKQAQAAALLMNASQGQQNSLSSDIGTSRNQEVAATLRTLMEQGNLTDEALRQAVYEKDVAATLRDAGLLDVTLERLGAQTQFDVNNIMNKAQGDLLETGKKKNRIGESLARKTLEGGVAVRDRQRDIDAKFSDMGFSAQADNAGIRNAGIMSSLQAQQASASGSLFTTLANVAALGGSLYNAYEMMRPTKGYQSPQRGGSSGGQGGYTPGRYAGQQYGPALPQVGPYGPVDIRR